MDFPFKESFQKLWKSKWPFGGIVAFLAAILTLVLSLFPQFENFELDSYDFRFVIRGAQDTEEDNIVIVGIDEQSIIGLQRWPFLRSDHAQVILNLFDAGAKLIILDIEFTEPAKNTRQDMILGGAIRRTRNVILAGKMVTEEFSGRATRNIYPLPPEKLFLDAGAHWGLANIDEDPDGFIRRYLLFQVHNERRYYPLSLYAYLLLQNDPDITSKITDYGDEFEIGDLRIPKRDFFNMLINFRGPAKSFPTYSYTDIIDDAKFKLPKEDDDTDVFELHKLGGTFKDKIVFIGASAEELQDTNFTPFFGSGGVKTKMPGVEVHANALSTLLRGDFISSQSKWSAILMVFVMAAASMVITKWLKPFRGLFVVMGLILGYFLWTAFAFNKLQLWVEFVTPMTAIVLSYIGNVVHQTLTEQRERIRVKKTWEHFMSQSVIDEMLDKGELPKFGGERRELTVLFSDIRGFTTYTENHKPKEVVHALNEYLTEMVDVIFKNNGTLDKTVGDEIMAVYGAPHYFKEHAEKACITALEMVKRLRALQRKWSANNQDYFQIGIGINSGKMILGNLGPSQLFDYTVIGDDVNLGARLEGANKQYGTTITISEFTQRAVRRKAKVRELDVVRVKGKNKPVRIFELRGMGSLASIEQDLVIDVYTLGLNYYKQLKFYQALTEFKRVLRYFPTDGPTRVYIKRCLDFIENPPPENWDGVYEFTTK